MKVLAQLQRRSRIQISWIMLAVFSIPLQSVAAESNVADSFIGHMQTRIQTLRMRHNQSAAGVMLENPRDLVHVYDRSGYTALWSSDQGWNDNTRRMMDYLADLPRHGLDPGNYHQDLLAQLLQQPSLANRIHADLLLSDAFLSLASDLAQGASSRFGDNAKSRRLLLRLKPSNDPAREFDALLPQSEDYWALTTALKQRLLEDPVSAQVWPVEADQLLKPGQRSEHVMQLRRRLQQTGDLTPLGETTPSDFFDPELAAALSRFQARNGLDDDGLLGPSTRRALNRDRHSEIEIISLNLERWRQLAPRYGSSHVRVNIAAQELAYTHQGRTELSMKVVAGRTARPTPTTQSAIHKVVFNPYWNVPQRIAVVDKLPQIRRDPGYLSERGFSLRASWADNAPVLDPSRIDWSQINGSNFSYHLRQEPGPQNALGQVKFLFPNDYSVYLHDTPSKDLFARSQRLFSSGCIRLEQPLALAEALLRNHAQANAFASALPQAYATNESVHLSEAVPVHLEYWTAWVDAQGELQIRNDVYERDAPVLNALRNAGAFSSATQLASISRDTDTQLAAIAP